jgi:hypothetical protein
MRPHPAPVSAALLLLLPGPALAGMPTVHLTDIARLRLQSISFFAALFLLSALFVRLLWNYLARDFSALPRLSYGKALGVVALWGLLFVLVLTMISGARELLTPGAWEKQGWTSRLAKDAPAADLDATRRRKLDDLRFALWDYARTHGGRLPSSAADADLPPERWQLPDPSGMRYVYVGGAAAGRRDAPLAYEPEVYGPERYVLFTSGEIRRLGAAELARALEAGKP